MRNVCQINHISIAVCKVCFKNMHQVLDLLTILIDLEEVCFEIVFARLCHINLDSSAENHLASMERLDYLKKVVPCNFEHSIGSSSLWISVSCNLSILGLHCLDNIGKLHVEGTSG